MHQVATLLMSLIQVGRCMFLSRNLHLKLEMIKIRCLDLLLYTASTTIQQVHACDLVRFVLQLPANKYGLIIEFNAKLWTKCKKQSKLIFLTNRKLHLRQFWKHLTLPGASSSVRFDGFCWKDYNTLIIQKTLKIKKNKKSFSNHYFQFFLYIYVFKNRVFVSFLT